MKKMRCDAVHLEVTGSHRLRLRFADGLEGEVDVASLVPFDRVFAPLRDPEEFGRARLDRELRTVVWPSGADLDPVVLYRHIERERASRAPR
jgi:hypothetical protein